MQICAKNLKQKRTSLEFVCKLTTVIVFFQGRLLASVRRDQNDEFYHFDLGYLY